MKEQINKLSDNDKQNIQNKDTIFKINEAKENLIKEYDLSKYMDVVKEKIRLKNFMIQVFNFSIKYNYFFINIIILVVFNLKN